MNITSDFNIQRNDHYGIYTKYRPLFDRDPAVRGDRNIAWRYVRYDALDRHPLDYTKLVRQYWLRYQTEHDQGAGSYAYGSLDGMFKYRQRTPYCIFKMTFGHRTNRLAYHRLIHRAYPKIRLTDVLPVEAHGMESAVDTFNRKFRQFKITDFNVHVDEFKHHCEPVHVYGRMLFFGHTKGGKPSFDLKHAIAQSFHGKQMDDGRVDHLDEFRRVVGRLVCHDMSKALQDAYPQAGLRFRFCRTYTEARERNRAERKHARAHNRANEQAMKSLRKVSRQLGRVERSLASDKASASRMVIRAEHAQRSVSASANSVMSSVVSSAQDRLQKYGKQYQFSLDGNHEMAMSLPLNLTKSSKTDAETKGRK